MTANAPLFEEVIFEPQQPSIHKLKVRSEFFNSVESGAKTFEYRRGDRGYKNGDILLLCEFDNGAYTGRELRRIITHVLRVRHVNTEDYFALSFSNPITLPENIKALAEKLALQALSCIEFDVNFFDGEYFQTEAEEALSQAYLFGSSEMQINSAWAAHCKITQLSLAGPMPCPTDVSCEVGDAIRALPIGGK